jgi:GNAT superfamily N-acetyltransferase
MSGRTSRRKREDAAAQRAATRYWHGGRAGLEPGTILIPRAEAERTGADLTHYELQRGYGRSVTDPERVYFASQREFARGFAGRLQGRDRETGVVFQHGSLYEVEPLGAIDIDPDFAAGGVSWCAPRARILAVEETNVQLHPHEISRRLGPYSAWQDGSPVYTSAGAYIPSPEQIAFGPRAALELSHDLFPWTPVEFINAGIAGVPSTERPDPREHRGVMIAGLESIHVWRHHRRRAQALLEQGITFARGCDRLDDVNELLPLAGHTVVGPDDERAVVVATHPRHGLLGVIVCTGADFAGMATMFIDAIVVIPRWRGKGLGSVLLLTAQQLLPQTVSFAAGHCEPSVARFFAQAGYTVLSPGTHLLLPTGDNPGKVSVGTEHCWFYRQGAI